MDLVFAHFFVLALGEAFRTLGHAIHVLKPYKLYKVLNEVCEMPQHIAELWTRLCRRIKELSKHLKISLFTTISEASLCIEVSRGTFRNYYFRFAYTFACHSCYIVIISKLAFFLSMGEWHDHRSEVTTAAVHSSCMLLAIGNGLWWWWCLAVSLLNRGDDVTVAPSHGYFHNYMAGGLVENGRVVMQRRQLCDVYTKYCELFKH